MNNSMSSAASSASLVSNSLTTELEYLNREQLIQRCQREIKLKEAVVNRSNSRKKKNELKREAFKAELELDQERAQHRLAMEKMQQDNSFMQQQIYEEQSIRIALENEKFRKSKTEGPMIPMSTWPLSMQEAHSSQEEGNASVNDHFSNCLVQQQIQEPQRSLTELKLDSFGYIRLPSANKRTKTPQWSRVAVHLSGAWLLFYKLQNGHQTSAPVIQINTM
uniref:Uncharacterized protein n=1 Tax=Ditylenchus dipsaci TaxID=166011 RepID=A0A915CX31_9BILA